MLAAQPMRSSPAGHGDRVFWSHARCSVRYYSAPVDRL
jgi:hypothetical protein